MLDLGKRITALRNEKGMSQEELAAALEVSRQSVSKWETGASVPELSKLVRLSEVFGVTLDELVKGESQEREFVPREVPQDAVKESTWKWTGQKIAGIILVCFGGLILALLSILGGFAAGLLFGFPFLGCGLICLLVKRQAGLWCGWFCFTGVNLYLRYATGISWSMVFLTPHFTPEMNYVRLVTGWVQFIALAVLIVCTWRGFRGWKFSTERYGMWKYAAVWGMLVLDLFAQKMASNHYMRRILEGDMPTSEFDWYYNLLNTVTDYIAVALVCVLLVQTAALVRAKRAKKE